MFVYKKEVVRALGLCSGGLDSLLSTFLLKSQGIEINWVVFETPFFSSNKAKIAAEKNNIILSVINITSIYMDIIKKPNCKFGKNLNPCMDCHALMFRLAGKLMLKEGFDFMFSGEVLGQRPMSQNKSSLRYVEKHSGHDGYILRPLSAKKLPKTIPEKEGIVRREYLLDISGRSRKRQMELAIKFGLKDYPSPGGGCLLTDKNYCIRLSDFLKYGDVYSENQLHLLGLGRHFRLSEQTKIIVGRNRIENDNIIKYIDNTCVVMKIVGIPGPIVIAPIESSDRVLSFAASIGVGYSKIQKNKIATVSVQYDNGKHKFIKTKGMSIKESRKFMIL